MKKVFLFAAMLAIAASCSVTEIDSIQGTTAPEITASYGDNGTKTILITDDEGVGTIWWKPADEINVFYETASAHYTSKNTENATTVAFGTTDVIGFSEASQNNIWGLYPYDENAVCDGESVTTTIPASQKGIAGTFDDDLFTSLAYSNSTTMTFYNVLGGIKFSLSRDDIKKITFKGNNNEDLVGKVKLTMDENDRPVAAVVEGEKTITLTPKEGTTFSKDTDYYIVMLPTVLSNGFTMTFETATEVGTFEYKTQSIEIKRSVFSKKENIDSYADFEEKKNALSFTANGEQSISLNNVGGNTPSLQYSYGGSSWTDWDYSALTFGTGEKQILYIRGNNPTGFSTNYDRNSSFVFSTEAQVQCSGNIMHLLSYTEDLTDIPSDYCFVYLFKACTSLVSAPELPATTLAKSCYSGMFSGCTGLQTAPELPATNLVESCYSGMFSYCTSLQKAPELPATTLAESCYFCMFGGCTSLQIAPELPATTLAESCYYYMFSGCTSLQTAPELPATTLAESCYDLMFFGCTSLQTAPELPATTLAESCYDLMFCSCTSLQTAPELPATTLAESCYAFMFMGCTNLVSVPKLPATTLAKSCYFEMFNGCKSLVSAPELPATTLAESCYFYMFFDCTSLQTAPELPATTLAESCYYYMFSGCTSLQTAPELPATTLAKSCYFEMFNGCKSLVSAPELPATTLAESCYSGMFCGCSNLNYVKAMFETTPLGYYTNNWLSGVSPTGTFVKSKNATWDVTGPSGIPEGWTVQIAE